MSKFEIIAITLSFIVGIGIAQLLSSLALVVRQRHEHSLHWLPILWAFIVLLFSVQYWFALFEFDLTFERWDWLWYGQFLFLAITLYLAGAFVLPSGTSRVPGGLLADFNLHGRIAMLALVAYLVGWIPLNARYIGGDVFAVPNVANMAMSILAMATYFSRNSWLRIVSSVSFLCILTYGLLFLYSNPSVGGD